MLHRSRVKDMNKAFKELERTLQKYFDSGKDQPQTKVCIYIYIYIYTSQVPSLSCY